jgi:hypothetical protein
MASDMVVALARATAGRVTLFGCNADRPPGEGQSLVRVPGRAFAPGEAVRAGGTTLPQVRHTHTVLACRPAGHWGYAHGLNEHGLAVGVTAVRTRLGGQQGLAGTDLVRLALERAGGACQAVDVLTDLVTRFGQVGPDADTDSAFLVADGREAFVVETAGPFWAEQVVGSVRAVSDFCRLHQDWDRIARGLADAAITQGWWPADGRKLDFAAAVGREGGEDAAGLRRWGRATLVLEQHSGQVDGPLVRRLLADHCPTPAAALSLCRHAGRPGEPATAASLVAEVGAPGTLAVAWCAFGPPCVAIWFPLLPAGDLPPAFVAEDASGGCRVWRRALRLAEAARSPGRERDVRAAVAALQEQFDHEARDFLAEAATLRQQGDDGRVARLAGSLMQHQVEHWEDACDELCPPSWRAAPLHHGAGHEYAAAGD